MHGTSPLLSIIGSDGDSGPEAPHDTDADDTAAISVLTQVGGSVAAAHCAVAEISAGRDIAATSLAIHAAINAADAGDIGLAIDWAHQATDHDPSHQALKAAEY